ncbi:MAG: hypothetical protein MUC29_00885 [Pyrinomonadaceae bacterium]|nr:hypothetical protein [Pyrinomonadaceae bacterium]
MLRAIALSLILLLSLGALIPLATDYSEAHPKHNHKKKKKKKLKKYSKAWWRWYHKKQKRKKAIAARKRALRIKRILAERREKARKAALLAQKENTATEAVVSENVEPKESKPTTPKTVETKTLSSKPAKIDKKGNPSQKVVAAGQDSEATLPSGENAPRGWKRGSSGDDYRIDDDNGNTIGNASISMVGQSSGEDNVNNKKTLGGVPTSALRRTVIDRMVKEEGWVVNDYQKEVNGRKVYVVVAQSPGPGNRVQSRIFYFTEVNGKIYSLSTNTSPDASDKIAKDSERVINSLLRRPVQADLR